MLNELIKAHFNTCGMKPNEIHLTEWRYNQLKQDFESKLTKPEGKREMLTSSSYFAGTYEGVKIIIHC